MPKCCLLARLSAVATEIAALNQPIEDGAIVPATADFLSPHTLQNSPAAATDVVEQAVPTIRDGLVMMPIEKYKKALGTTMARHLAARRGESIYQVVSCSLPFVPKTVLEHLLASEEGSKESISEGMLRWNFETLSDVKRVATPLLELAGAADRLVAGTTRALKTKSERFSRVVASMMAPMEITHMEEEERVVINFCYVLADEAGELHKPKAQDRREMAISSQDELLLRQNIKQDLMQMAESASVLASPTFSHHADGAFRMSPLCLTARAG